MTTIINKRAASFTLISFVVFLHPLHGCAVGTNQTSPRPPAVIVFGDSVVDPGNNNAILTIVKCNYPPYGKDFVSHRATGRFSNGKIPSDLIASQLGIKEYVPAYLGTELSAYDLITGVSFASGGCGFDPLTSQLVVSFMYFLHLGARRISVANIPPIGCLPSQRTLAGGIERICDPTF